MYQGLDALWISIRFLSNSMLRHNTFTLFFFLRDKFFFLLFFRDSLLVLELYAVSEMCIWFDG